MTDPLLDALQRLPEEAPPEHLWRRIHRAREKSREQHAARIHTSLATIALAALFGLGLWPTGNTPSTPSATGNSAESLHAVDRALQAGYARGASDEELAPLWHLRHQLTTRTRSGHAT